MVGIRYGELEVTGIVSTDVSSSLLSVYCKRPVLTKKWFGSFHNSLSPSNPAFIGSSTRCEFGVRSDTASFTGYGICGFRFGTCESLLKQISY